MPEFKRRREVVSPSGTSSTSLSWWLTILAWLVVALTAAVAWALQLRIADVDAHQRGWLIFTGSTRSLMFWTGVVCQLIATGLPALIGAYERRLRRRAEAEAFDQTVARIATIDGILKPLVATSGRLAENHRRGLKAGRRELVTDGLRIAMAGLHDLYGGTNGGTRVMFFAVEGQAPSRTLSPKEQHGRGPKSKTFLHEGQGHRAIDTFKALDEGTYRLWHLGDPGDRPSGWNETKPYRSFFAIPVATETRLYGMLTMDHPDPATFDEDDIPVVQLIADNLAVILALG